MVPLAVRWDFSLAPSHGDIVRTQYARMAIEMPQMMQPSRSQKRLPRNLTKTNMNAVAVRTLTMPKMPVRKRDEETDVKPAETKMVGASDVRC